MKILSKYRKEATTLAKKSIKLNKLIGIAVDNKNYKQMIELCRELLEVKEKESVLFFSNAIDTIFDNMNKEN